MKSYYPMQKLTAALLTGEIERIKTAAEAVDYDDRYDIEASSCIKDAIDLGWKGRGLEEVLSSKAGEYYEVLEVVVDNGERLGLTCAQLGRMLESCRSKHPDIIWDPSAKNLLKKMNQYRQVVNLPEDLAHKIRAAWDEICNESK